MSVRYVVVGEVEFDFETEGGEPLRTGWRVILDEALALMEALPDESVETLIEVVEAEEP